MPRKGRVRPKEKMRNSESCSRIPPQPRRTVTAGLELPFASRGTGGSRFSYPRAAGGSGERRCPVSNGENELFCFIIINNNIYYGVVLRPLCLLRADSWSHNGSES